MPYMGYILTQLTFPTEKKAIDILLSQHNVILKVINSSRKITEKNIDRFEKKCKKSYVYQRKRFPFWPMNDSIHRLWAHRFQSSINADH